jgi:iron-sulfur cluster repair protein YtfE (RIC family)
MNDLLSKVSPSITKMIRMDHTHVMANFHRYELDKSPQTKQALVNTICLGLEIHAQLEEEIFYPAVRAVVTDRAVMDKLVPEHDEMRRLIGSLRSMQATDANYDQTIMGLMREVMHHVADEETIVLPAAERGLGEKTLSELGAQMTKRRFQLAGPRIGEIAVNQARAMPAATMLVAAGAVVAGTYVIKRALTRHHF